MNRDLRQMLDENDGEFPGHAWPGCYPILYVPKDGGSICANCADDCPEDVEEFFIHYEGEPEVCDACGTPVESAYGDPDAPEPEEEASKNEKRAAIGRSVVEFFASLPLADNGDDEDNVTDILTNLMHAFGLDTVTRSFTKAVGHHHEETYGGQQ